MRTRIIKSPAFNESKILGAILFEQTMDSKIDGKSRPRKIGVKIAQTRQIDGPQTLTRCENQIAVCGQVARKEDCQSNL